MATEHASARIDRGTSWPLALAMMMAMEKTYNTKAQAHSGRMRTAKAAQGARI